MEKLFIALCLLLVFQMAVPGSECSRHLLAVEQEESFKTVRISAERLQQAPEGPDAAADPAGGEAGAPEGEAAAAGGEAGAAGGEAGAPEGEAAAAGGETKPLEPETTPEPVEPVKPTPEGPVREDKKGSTDVTVVLGIVNVVFFCAWILGSIVMAYFMFCAKGGRIGYVHA